MAKADQPVNIRLPGVLLRLRHQLRIYLDADGPDAIILRRRNRDTAVAAAKVIEHVAFFDLRHAQHFGDRLRRSWIVNDVRLAQRTLLSRATLNHRYTSVCDASLHD